MKNILLTLLSLLVVYSSGFGQTEQGTKFIGMNYSLAESSANFGAMPNTAIQFLFMDDVSIFGAGLDGGYFLSDDFALLGGLGFQHINFNDIESNSTSIGLKLGAEYFINSKFPIGIDINTALNRYKSSAFGDTEIDENIDIYLGVQAGYAWFVNKNLAIKPYLRYGIPIQDNFDKGGIFSLNVGVGYFFGQKDEK